jgi:hypothetical protein
MVFFFLCFVFGVEALISIREALHLSQHSPFIALASLLIIDEILKLHKHLDYLNHIWKADASN